MTNKDGSGRRPNSGTRADPESSSGSVVGRPHAGHLELLAAAICDSSTLTQGRGSGRQGSRSSIPGTVRCWWLGPLPQSRVLAPLLRGMAAG